MWLFLTVQWVGLQCVIVIFPGHIHLLGYFRTLEVERLLLSLKSITLEHTLRADMFRQVKYF